MTCNFKSRPHFSHRSESALSLDQARTLTPIHKCSLCKLEKKDSGHEVPLKSNAHTVLMSLYQVVITTLLPCRELLLCVLNLILNTWWKTTGEKTITVPFGNWRQTNKTFSGQVNNRKNENARTENNNATDGAIQEVPFGDVRRFQTGNNSQKTSSTWFSLILAFHYMQIG